MTALESLKILAKYSRAELIYNSEYGDMPANIKAGGEILTAVKTLACAMGVDIDVLNDNEHVKSIRSDYEWAKEVLGR